MGEKLEYKIKIKDLPIEERPRERLINFGPKALSNAELLAIILRTGSRKETAIDLSNKLLKDYNITSLSQISVGELNKIFGIGEAKACQIIACFELGRRLASYTDKPKPMIKTSQDVANLFMPEMRYLKKEHFKGIYLDSKNKVMKEENISVGSLNASIIHPREVLRTAISEAAAAIILVHNHPSGDPSPSKDDIELTKRLIEAGNLMGIEVLDHIIIGDDRYISLKERELI